MFFGQEEKTDISQYVKEQWVTISQFCEKLLESSPLLLRGYGFAKYQQNGQFIEDLGYHFVKINDRIFGFCGESKTSGDYNENTILSFRYINEFDPAILTSNIFESNQFKSNSNYYRNFEAELLIDAKVYTYQDEEKLLLSKKGQGNIDLYCSYQIKNISNEFLVKVYPAAFTAAKHLAMKKMLDERVKNLKK